MRKTIILVLSFFCCFCVSAQIKNVTIQASGLTCSMCSNAIFKSLQTLEEVDSITPNIKTSSFIIVFKSGSSINFDRLKKKVEDAGFFVARMDVQMAIDTLSLYNDVHIERNGFLFHFVHVTEQTLRNEINFRIIDKGYLTTKESKRFAAYTSMPCYATGLTEACCVHIQQPLGTRIYHATL